MLQVTYLSVWLAARFSKSERGASLIEYSLLIALIALVCIAAARTLGTSTSDKFRSFASEFDRP